MVRGWQRRRWVQRALHILTSPPLVWGLFALSLWVWHLPALYQAAIRHPTVHIVEHVSLIAAASLFWWLILQPLGRRRLNYGAAVFFIFTTSVHSTVLGALLTFAPTPLYPVYASSTQLWGLTPLEDQRLAGLVMRLPMSLTFLVTAAYSFCSGYARSKRKRRDWEPPPTPKLTSRPTSFPLKALSLARQPNARARASTCRAHRFRPPLAP